MGFTQGGDWWGHEYPLTYQTEARVELGHGTCGQVIWLRHKHTRTMMAVKVIGYSGRWLGGVGGGWGGGHEYPLTDFEALNELGHGTCGQVIRMRHKHSRTMMAVKVIGY